MTFLFIAFIAGVLTVLAPCILPLLPVVIGSSAVGRGRATPFIVVGSLAVSIILFTYLLKVSTAFIYIAPEVWTYISGGILFLFGAVLLFPGLWENLPGIATLSAKSNKLVGTGYQKKSIWGDILMGAALGPVFSSCSPTYFVILASVLPASFALGSLYLFAYVLGLSLVLLLLGVLGERLASRLEFLANPSGWFKRGIGVVFVILGLLIVTGIEKKIETALLTGGFFDVTQIEQRLLQNQEMPPLPQGDTPSTDTASSSEPLTPAAAATLAKKSAMYQKAPELVAPDAYLNTGGEPITIGQYRGKKVVLIDFWTYSCINCQRTLPYLRAWYDTYENEGLVIIGVHTPEFGFEKVAANVEEAIGKEGVRYPVVLDNEYQTWNAFRNQYWPRKYLIDIDGYIIYDHAGEGAYDETETAIRKALAERAERLGAEAPVSTAAPVSATGGGIVGSPETYFGSARNSNFGNGLPGVSGTQTFSLPSSYAINKLYLSGTWKMEREYAESTGETTVIFDYNAREVYLVASAEEEVLIEVWQDGEKVSTVRGADVSADGTVTIGESRLYKILKNPSLGEHVLELRIKGKGARLYTFTFG